MRKVCERRKKEKCPYFGTDIVPCVMTKFLIYALRVPSWKCAKTAPNFWLWGLDFFMQSETDNRAIIDYDYRAPRFFGPIIDF